MEKSKKIRIIAVTMCTQYRNDNVMNIFILINIYLCTYWPILFFRTVFQFLPSELC